MGNYKGKARKKKTKQNKYLLALLTSAGADRFPKRAFKRGHRIYAPLGNLVDFNSLKSPFLGFRIIQTGYWPIPFTLGEALQLGKSLFIYLFYFFIKNIYAMKNLTDFRKTVETVVDLRLLGNW